MRRFTQDCPTVTEALVRALEQAEGAEHVLIILDRGDSFDLLGDSEQTRAQANFNLDAAKLVVLGRGE